MSGARGLELAVDRGGTFTDVVAVHPDGTIETRKLLSHAPGRYDDPVLAVVRALTDATARAEAAKLSALRLGTTLATNALLERKGARVALVVTEGFADLLAIGEQDRPSLFALAIEKPAPLYAAVVEARERVLACGSVRTPLDGARLRGDLDRLRADGIEAVAIALLHSYAHPAHEREAAAIARAAGFAEVYASNEVSPEIHAVARAGTTVLDAYLTPILRRYTARLAAALAGARLRCMRSSGGLAAPDRFHGKDAILSGPAGGAIACAHLARELGLRGAIGFDMGGTSTDVHRVSPSGALERTFDVRVHGLRLRAPSLDLVTVAAGGGSVLGRAPGRLTVGPESAGALPGPACYGHGGPASVTDANLILGRLDARFAPRAFGPEGDRSLDLDAARAAIAPLAAAASRSVEDAAAGFVEIADHAMADAIREVSVARGHDPREHALIAFGGAAGQHACAVARALGIGEVVLHPLASVLSAYGIALAEPACDRAQSLLAPLDEALVASLPGRLAALQASASAELAEQGADPARIAHEALLELRYEGVEGALLVPLADLDGADDAASRDDAAARAAAIAATLREAFERAHERRFGYRKRGRAIEATALRSTSRAAGRASAALGAAPPAEPHAAPADATIARARVWVFGAPHAADALAEADRTLPPQAGLRPADVPVIERARLSPGAWFDGPALLIEPDTQTVIEPGWRARVDGRRVIRVTWTAPETEPAHAIVGAAVADAQPDPVRLEVYQSAFMSIAREMGTVLGLVAHSTNMRERLDYSCAVFDPEGHLVANAPHIPVHLGAMGESVRAILEARSSRARPGEVYATNDPFAGGSHLPDVTVVSPVFAAGAPRPVAWVASRGHHADMGGEVPGSMPPFSRTIDEEGVRFHDVCIVRDGALDEAAIRAVLERGPHPVRAIDERLQDLEAQVAANRAGEARVLALAAERGLTEVHAYMEHVRANAEAATREAIAALGAGTHRFFDHLDDGARIEVAIRVEGGRAEVDFTGTSPQLTTNLNAPRAVTMAAVLYAFRALVRRAIPLNAGSLAPIRVVVPPGSLLAPTPPAAVCGGNVETSMRIVDVLLGALGAAAASQGTMNNLTFGNDRFGYYETICGGAGAGPGFAGASAVHVHMTNTRITDAEVLERRYPVVVRSFAIRRGTGGRGLFAGGDGVRRAIEARAPLAAAILSERRGVRPFGLAGGEPGARGRNALLTGARTIELPGKVALALAPGDVLIIETPGGGGFGAPDASG